MCGLSWDDWNALYEVERQLTELLLIGDFPAGGVSRLEALEEGARLARQYHDSTERDVRGCVDERHPAEEVEQLYVREGHMSNLPVLEARGGQPSNVSGDGEGSTDLPPQPAFR